MKIILIASLFIGSAALPAQKIPGKKKSRSLPVAIHSISLLNTFRFNRIAPITIVGNSFCDDVGNVYAAAVSMHLPSHKHLYLNLAPEAEQAPLIQYNLHSREMIQYRYSLGMHEMAGMFTVDPEGHVYRLIINYKTGYKVLKFNHDGTLDRSIKIHAQYHRYSLGNLAVFSNGDFLLNGMIYSGKGEAVKGKSFLIIDDEQGNFVTNVKMPHAERLIKSTPLMPDDQYAILYASSPNGMIYMMLPSNIPMIYEISPDGLVVHTFAIKDLYHYKYYPASISATGQNDLMVEFDQVSHNMMIHMPKIMALVDGNHGEIIKLFKPNPAGGMLICSVGHNTFEYMNFWKNNNNLTITQYTAN